MSRIRSSDITARGVYLSRRSFMQGLVAAGSAVLVADTAVAGQPAAHGRKLTTVRSALSTTEKPNSWDDITTYNNFYEFGTGKSDPAANAPKYRPAQPWTPGVTFQPPGSHQVAAPDSRIDSCANRCAAPT